MEWQPIETAPERGEVLITGLNGNVPGQGRWVAMAKRGSHGWYNGGDDTYTFHPPTHWMPVPEPPKDEMG